MSHSSQATGRRRRPSRTPSPTVSQPLIELRGEGQTCRLFPPCEDITAPLTYRQIVPQAQRSGETRLLKRERPLFPDLHDQRQPDRADTDITLPHLWQGDRYLPGFEPMLNGGMAEVVVEWAKLRGYNVVDRFQPPPSVSMAALTSALQVEGFPQVSRLLTEEIRGLVRHALDSNGIAQLVTEVARSLPEATLAFLTLQRDAARSLFVRLPPDVQRQCTVADSDSAAIPRRLLLGTPHALAPHGQLMVARDVTVLLNAMEIAGRSFQAALANYATRLFGLLRFDAAPSPRQSDLMFAAFGPYETTAPSIGIRRRTVETSFVVMAEGRHHTDLTTPCETQRQFIWRCRRRNEALAAVAGCLKDGAPIRQRLARPLPAAWRRPLRVVVVVESVDHGMRLGRLLASWPVVADNDAYLDHSSTVRVQTLDRFLQDRKPFVIATASAAEHLPWDRYDAVVAAGAGSGLPTFADRLTCPAGEDHRLLVVDVADRQPVSLRRDTAYRKSAYESADWFPAGMNPGAGRVRRYLAQRGATL